MQTHAPTVVQEVGGWNSLPPSVFGTVMIRYDILRYYVTIRHDIFFNR